MSRNELQKFFESKKKSKFKLDTLGFWQVKLHLFNRKF